MNSYDDVVSVQTAGRILEQSAASNPIALADVILAAVAVAQLSQLGINVKDVMMALIVRYPNHAAPIYVAFEKPCDEDEVWANLEHRYPDIRAKFGEDLLKI